MLLRGVWPVTHHDRSVLQEDSKGPLPEGAGDSQPLGQGHGCQHEVARRGSGGGVGPPLSPPLCWCLFPQLLCQAPGGPCWRRGGCPSPGWVPWTQISQWGELKFTKGHSDLGQFWYTNFWLPDRPAPPFCYHIPAPSSPTTHCSCSQFGNIGFTLRQAASCQCSITIWWAGQEFFCGSFGL